MLGWVSKKAQWDGVAATRPGRQGVEILRCAQWRLVWREKKGRGCGQR
jgi:hypothetical protein